MSSSAHDRDYCTPGMVAQRNAPGAAVCIDEDCELSGGYAHAGECAPCKCGKNHAVEECPWDPNPERCSCGATATWDPHVMGRTVGGLMLVGGFLCPACKRQFMGPGSREAEHWRLVGGGRSIDVGTTRLRAEKSTDPTALFTRIVKLPALELALKRIAAMPCASSTEGCRVCASCIAKMALV